MSNNKYEWTVEIYFYFFILRNFACRCCPMLCYSGKTGAFFIQFNLGCLSYAESVLNIRFR